MPLIRTTRLASSYVEYLERSKVHYEACDDLTILANDLTASRGMTLCGPIRNEIYFLPAFLEHYRKLGVERFILLDDRSEDGTRDYLATQPDVMILGSEWRFGDTFFPTTGPLAGRRRRMVHIWRTLMMQKFCIGRWALCLDADEFISLPTGWRFQDLIAKLPREGAHAITGVMLDTYPENISELHVDNSFNPMGNWYVDGYRHVSPRFYKTGFRTLYPGARARLLHDLGLVKETRLRMLKRIVLRRSRYPKFNSIVKTVLMKWKFDSAFLDSHRTTLQVNQQALLPILHFKFTPDLYRRSYSALTEEQYSNASSEYRVMKSLLAELEAAGGYFLCRNSHLANDFRALCRNGNAMLPLNSNSHREQ